MAAMRVAAGIVETGSIPIVSSSLIKAAPSLRGAIATKQSIPPLVARWIASLTLAMTWIERRTKSISVTLRRPQSGRLEGRRDRQVSDENQQALRRSLAERADDVVDDILDQDAVVALAHHANHGLGAGGADQQAAVAVEPLLAVGDRGLDLGVVERLAAAVAHVLQYLRQRIKTPADLRHRAAQLLHHGQHLQRRNEAVAGGGVVGQDD